MRDIKPTDMDMLLDYKTFVSSERDQFLRKMKLLAWMNKQLENKNLPWINRIVLVGGTAVELYTGGSYGSVDIDVLSSDSSILDELLLPVGYKKESRFWYNDDDNLAIECPDYTSYEQKYDTIDLGFGPICVLSLEDLIMDRIDQYQACHHKDDKKWAKVLIKSHYNRIDFNRLKQMSEKSLATPAYKEILKEVNRDANNARRSQGNKKKL